MNRDMGWNDRNRMEMMEQRYNRELQKKGLMSMIEFRREGRRNRVLDRILDCYGVMVNRTVFDRMIRYVDRQRVANRLI